MAFQPRQYMGVWRSVEFDTATVAPGAVGAGAIVNEQVTLSANGALSQAAIGDVVDAIPPAAAAPLGLVWVAAVTSAGVVSLTFINGTAGSITPVSSTWTFVVTRPVHAGE